MFQQPHNLWSAIRSIVKVIAKVILRGIAKLLSIVLSMKKKRRSRAGRKGDASGTTTEALEKKATVQLSTQNYRDAINTYKQLLKREQRPEWLDALGQAYLERARELASKEMYREAASLWENRASLCRIHQNLDLYIAWLLESGRFTRAARMFAEADDTFRQGAEGQHVAALLAGRLAMGESEIANSLPTDSPLIQQRDTVVAAMQAYCQGNDTALAEYLKAIPYRSPYRDLRLILQALPQVADDVEAATALVARIPHDSPFKALAKRIGSAGLDDRELFDALAGLEPAPRELILALKGWDEDQIKLANELLSQREKQVPGPGLFKLVAANQTLFDATEARRFCLALLPDFPRGIAAYEKHFGALTAFERNRLAALAAERNNDPGEAIKHWRHCVEHLRRQGEKQDDNALQAALILRHLADLPAPGFSPRDRVADQRINYLAQSLELDPEDKDTYLTLVRLTQDQRNTKARDQWIERAVKRFPEDADILMTAANAAYRRGAFKKAAGFAEMLLRRDPINKSARGMLVSSHLSHARKQIIAGKKALAEKELTRARDVARDDEHHAIVAFNQGFLALRSGANEAGLELLREAHGRLGGGLLAHFRLLMEGQQLKIDQRMLGRYVGQLRIDPHTPATAQEVTLLADLLSRYVSDGVKGMARVLERLRKSLKEAATLRYEEKELRGICDALERVGHHGLLKDYADAGLKRYGQRPAFVYYSIFGRTKGQHGRIQGIEHFQMSAALDTAIDEDDRQMIDKFEKFLKIPAFGFGPLPRLPHGPPPNLQDMLDDLMDEFDLDDPEDLLDMLDDLARGTHPPMPDRRGRKR